MRLDALFFVPLILGVGATPVQRQCKAKIQTKTGGSGSGSGVNSTLPAGADFGRPTGSEWQGKSMSGHHTWSGGANGKVPSAAVATAPVTTVQETTSNEAPAVVTSSSVDTDVVETQATSSSSREAAAAQVTSEPVVATSKSTSPPAVTTAKATSQAPAAPTSSAAPAETTTSTAAAAAGSGSTSGTDSGSAQVGLAWTSTSGAISQFKSIAGSKLSWYYNWALTASSNDDGVPFVPQVWGSGSVSGVAAASGGWGSGITHVLSFNEPDIATANGGSAIDAATAATLHQQWVGDLTGSYQIGSPAVARGGKTWLTDWISACAGKCQYDFIPFHFYGTDANDLISYVQDFHSTFGKPLWLTEAACHDYSTGQICTEAQAQTFMDTAVAYFRGDGASMIERWSWFGASPDLATSGDGNALENADTTPSTLAMSLAARFERLSENAKLGITLFIFSIVLVLLFVVFGRLDVDVGPHIGAKISREHA